MTDEARSPRSDWPIHKLRGKDPGSVRVPDPEESLAAMWPLAVEAWTLAGRPLPEYERHECPVVRGEDDVGSARS